MNERLKKIALRIVELENEIYDKPDKRYFDEMEKLVFGLSIKDIIEIDDYIQKEKLLTK